jgi:plastocyanin
MTLTKTKSSVSRRSLEFIVPFLCLIFAGIRHFVAFLSNYPSSTLMYSLLTIGGFVGALAIWRGGRVGYLVAIAFSLFFSVTEGYLAGTYFGAVTEPVWFLEFVTGVPTVLAALIYSILGLRQVWETAVPQKPSRTIPASGFVILLVLGFILGGVTIGLIAAPTELRLAHGSSSVAADITIVQGAGNPNNGQFYSPSSYDVKVGTTVTWVNDDGTTHTVTSSNGTFSSGPLPPGASFSYTFTQPGTYGYTCSYHPWMTGTITVTSG